MSIRVEKETGDIVITGFDEGIAPSPHKGFANMQGVNLSTEPGEVMCNFPRVQDTMTSTAIGTGSLAFADSSHVSLSISGSNNLFKGQWITVTNSTHTGELPNGTYYVPPTTGANFQLQPYWNTVASPTTAPSATYLIVGGGNGGNGGVNGTNGGSVGGNGGNGGNGGQITTGSTTLTAGSFPIVVGTGGTAGTANGGTGGTGGNSTALGFTGTGGGGTTGATGGAGGNGTTGGGGNNGTNGTSSSITGTAYTYGSSGAGAGGGNGSGGSPNISAPGGTGGTGAGNGGNGGSTNNTANPTVGTAGTNYGAGGGGGGGGGCGSASFTAAAGAAGSSGIVIISYQANQLAGATGGTISYFVSGGILYKIHTFTSNGTFTVPAFTTTFANSYTAGLTATIQLVANMGKPIAKAQETYFRSNVVYYRYYVLDSNGLVWVYDTYNETLYSSTDNVNWLLPDYHAAGTSASGIGVIDGIVIVSAQNGLWAKSTSNLGNTNTTATNWIQVPDATYWQSGAQNSTHFAYVGHQGRFYVTDGNYISSIFPDSTLSQTVAGTATLPTTDNVQSLASWTVDGSQTSPEAGLYGIASIIAGDQPYTADGGFLPAVFFAPGGQLPYTMSANTVYYIKQSTTAGALTDFQVYVDPTMPQSSIKFKSGSALTLTGNLSSGATSGTLTANWDYATGTYPTTFTQSGGTQTLNVTYTNGSAAITLVGSLTAATTNTSLTVYGTIDISSGSVGTQYYQTFYPLTANADSAGSTPTYIWTPQALTLPPFEIAQCMTEIGDQIIIGCASNVLYPWDQSSNLPTNIISLPEANTQTIITVHQMAYVFAGSKGNIYITDGSAASLVTKVPDYCAGIPGTPSSYIEPYFTWTDAMYLRGRICFSIIDETSSKAGNCGGIWSFIPTQNFSLSQDVGISLRLVNQNSYGTYNGAALLLIPRVNQQTNAPNFFSAWESDITAPAYGIDASGSGTNASFPAIIETQLIPTGTMLEKKTFSRFEYKLSAPLDTNATVTMNYRTNATDSWTALTSLQSDTTISGYYPADFEKSQYLQLQVILTPITSTTGSFNRLAELRIH